MAIKYINSKNFDNTLNKLLKSKKGKNVVLGRLDIEPIILNKKSEFIINFFLSLNSIIGLTYRILFWEKNEQIENFINSKFSNKQYEIKTLYRNGKLPGVMYIEEKTIDVNFLETLLQNHFNYEMAVDPSLNLRVQICINQKDFTILLDIYDDRGFNIYYLTSS